MRIPAAACGVVGLKPTYGRVSKFGVTTLSWSLDTCGPLARSAADCAVVLEAIAGHDPRDPTTSRRPVERYGEGLGAGASGLRVGVPREDFWERIDPEVEAGVRAAINELAVLGATVEEVSIPWARHAFAPANLISWVEASVFHEPWKARWASDYGEEILQRVVIGQAIPAADYVRAQQARRAFAQRARRLFERIDLLAAPTCPIPAPPIADDVVKVGGEAEPVRSAVGRLCRFASFSGFPAIAVPCGFTSAGLPISLQLVGRPFEERTVLRLAHAYERATEWHSRRPPVEAPLSS